MTNWRLWRNVNNTILAVGAISLFGITFGILPELNEKFFIANWGQILGAGLLWVLYSFNRMFRV